jgi:hypothetical protein
VLNWNIVANKPVTVTISGPNGFSSSDLSGSSTVCPVDVVAGKCPAPPGAYAFVLKATDHLGRLVYSKTIQLNVNHS